MVRLNRIYTRTGDAGQTRLAGGAAVPKTHPRLEACGTIDELNACLGVVRQRCTAGDAQTRPARERVDAVLEEIQQRLFDLGAALATPAASSSEPGATATSEADTRALEELMDELNEELPELRSFVLPGGGPIGAALHLARTVCRRAERRAFELAALEGVAGTDLRYLNRLSDLLFVLGRWAAARVGEPEVLWSPR